MILREAKRIVRERGPLVIAETRHGFICASAGVDHSNAPEPGTLVLLPLDPDASARAVARPDLRELTGADGRRDRHRLVRAAVPAGHDGCRDRRRGRARRSSTCAARPTGSATSSARAGSRSPTRSQRRPTSRAGKAEGVPAVVVRGLQLEGDGTAQEIVIEHELDLFR